MGTAPGSGQLLAGLDRPINDSALPTTTELKSMLNQGVTPIAFTDGGAPYVVRAVTSQCKGSGSNFDYRVRDAHIVTVSYRFTNDLVARTRRRAVDQDHARPGWQPPRARRRVCDPTPRQGADRATAERLRKQRLD